MKSNQDQSVAKRYGDDEKNIDSTRMAVLVEF